MASMVTRASLVAMLSTAVSVATGLKGHISTAITPIAKTDLLAKKLLAAWNSAAAHALGIGVLSERTTNKHNALA